MLKLINKLMYVSAVFVMFLSLVSCGGGSSGTGPAGATTGTLELGLTDAATGSYQAIYVTIAEVQVKKQGEGEGEAGWETILLPEQTYNLLELVNGVIATLGITELLAGQYGQMRLILAKQPDGTENILNAEHPYANYLIDSEGTSHELKVPSGYQTGIKIVKGFSIAVSQTTELLLDFDAAKSVVQAGKSGKWLLKPTIKVLESMENLVSGVIDDGVNPIAGAMVSAQFYDPDALDPEDEVIVETTTVSTDAGGYKLYLPPDIYNIVVTREGYLPACQEIAAQFFEEYGADFSLTAATESITISGTVSGLAAEEDSAHLSIRQTADCGSGDVMIEVASTMVAEGGSYSITLPLGTYDVAASAVGETTQVIEDISSNTTLDVVF